MNKRDTLNRAQIVELASKYRISIVSTYWSGNIMVTCNSETTNIGQWEIIRHWSKDEWRSCFELVSGTKTADLWQRRG